tara:strand:+ start:2751 stop:3422 length:672 start_codon:yes stop_codon:yes gene_type:complete
MSVNNSLGNGNDNPMPIGSMLFLAATNSAKGDLGQKWLVADGRYLKRDEYPDLFYWIGDVFGSQDATDFRLPQSALTNFNGTKGLLPLPTATNDGAVDTGDGGVASLNATLTEANIPPISWDGQSSAVDGTGFDVDNSVWNSVVDNGRQVAEADFNGATNDDGSFTAKQLLYNTPATGASDIATTTPATIDKTATPTPITDTIALRGELPSRFEMRMMIKANY